MRVAIGDIQSMCAHDERSSLHEPCGFGEARLVHVSQREVTAAAREGHYSQFQIQRGLGVVGDDRLVADLLEELSEDLADRLIVVDDQYAHRVCPRGGYPCFQQSAYHW